VKHYRDDGSGNIFEKHGAFHVRWWYVNGDGVRRQRSQKICDKSRECASLRSKKVLELAQETLQRERGPNNKDGGPVHDQPIAEFYDDTYLPFCEAQFALGDLKPSSLHSLKQIWNQHLRDHFGATALRQYRRATASQFLTDLAARYSRNTISHVRGTMSGIFTHALNLDLIEANPLRDCKALRKGRKPRETEHYSLTELENIVNALVAEPELQLVACLMGFAALRRGEIEALRWEDFDDDFVHVRRAVSRTVVTTPKSESSVESMPLIAPVKLALEAWRHRCKGQREGWVFPGRFGQARPGVMSARERKIKTILAAKRVPWRGFHSGRRALATILTHLTNSPLAAAQGLRHSNYAITIEKYIKQDRRALAAGMKMLESKVMESGK